MKSLDEQVPGAESNVVSATSEPPAPAHVTPPPVGARPGRARSAGVVGAVIVVALVGMAIRLTADGIQNAVNERAAIAKISPTSRYNAKLSAVLDRHQADLDAAAATLAEASYLESSPDYGALDLALSDARTELGLSGIDLLSAVSKHQYDQAIVDIDKSLAVLRTAQLVVIADMGATPAPAAGGTT